MIVNNLHFSYGGSKTIDGIDFSVEGGVVSILGPNGSGKTTLLKLINALLKPSDGEILINGRDVFSLGRRELARTVTLVSQEFETIFDHTVLDVVMMGAIPRSLFPDEGERKRALEILRDFGLEDLALRSFRSLSGGEKRLVLFAKAIFQGFDVLTVDEVELHLDPKHRAAIGNLLKKIASSGKTVLSVFHDINLALSVSDRVLGLKNGKLIFDSKPESDDIPEALEYLYDVKFKAARLGNKWILEPEIS